jgi:3-hydroxyisobutyrate dehydrogenase-like beta-hydroxyacid dehydrogenase
MNSVEGQRPEQSPILRVAVLGLGEAGSRLAADLARDVPSISRAADPASAATGCDVVLSVNTAKAALDAAAAALPGLRANGIYADLNTASPELKRELAELLGEAGVGFVDVALLGPIPAQGLFAPVLVSGAAAQAFADIFAPLGVPVTVVSREAGDAAALKLVRSVFMKGLAASVVESMQAAEAVGRAEWLEREIEAMIGRAFLERALDGSRKHAARRVDEMEAARDLLLELGVEPLIATASAAQLAELATTEDR